VSLQSSGAALAGDDPTGREITALAPWFHNLHLPGGAQTAPDHPLGDFPRFKWKQLAPEIPQDLHGARALDIGCNAGFYSFELAARGASVLAIDLDAHYLRQARWAAERLDPEGRVSFEQAQVYELARIQEEFDLVLFLGVLYHLRHPLLALDLVASRVRGRLILQTLTMPGGRERALPADLDIDDRRRLTRSGWPRAAFIEHSLAGDPTNWWAADDACVRAMIRSAGLEVVGSPGHEIYVCQPAAGEESATASLREAELRAVLGDQAARPGSAPADPRTGSCPAGLSSQRK
jgi:tRNA (mo5U34)-methyltransferase